MQKYPVAELFNSPQGEGLASGRYMFFIRLAGCNVGERFSKESYEPKQEMVYHERDSQSDYAKTVPGLPIYVNKCTTWDGREFACDTDYRSKRIMTVDEILAEKQEGVSCVNITGGEPFIHDLGPLIEECLGRMIEVHIETSGTRDGSQLVFKLRNKYNNWVDWYRCGLWITCAPKKGWLPEMIKVSNQLKLLVDKDFRVESMPYDFFHHPLVYLCPINDEKTLNEENMQHCLEIQKRFPQFWVGQQSHKMWGVR